jgi:hypothetical protein
MERGFGKPLFFDGTNYPYWKIRMSAHLQGIDWLVWEIYEDATYVVLKHPGVTQVFSISNHTHHISLHL